MRRSGSIRQRSPGSFELRYSIGIDPATGRRKSATVTVRGTLKEAERELRRLLHAVDTGEAIEPNKLLVRDWFRQWLDMVKPELSPMTWRTYEQFVRLYLSPRFGNHLLAKLTPAHIQAAYSALAEGGRRDMHTGPLAPASRRLLHRILTTSLNRALELQLIARNPALVLRRRLPKLERGEMAVLSPDQNRELLDATRGTDLFAPVLIALATGARRGEIAAMRWRHIDLNRADVLIAEAARELKRGNVAVGSTKSGKVRRVTLPGMAVDELRAWKREQAEQLLQLGVRQSGATFVCTRLDGEPISPSMLTDRFRDLAARLGLPVHFHSLRHTHASQLLLAGAHPRTMQERLGR
jgi:integrase